MRSCSSGRDQVWAIWAACGYLAAQVMLWRWGARTAAVLVSVALAVLAPLLWLSVAYPLEDGMNVIARSAGLLLHHGSPYLTASQVSGWLSYNPYLPVMTLFGVPAAAGLGGLARQTPGSGWRWAPWRYWPRRSGSPCPPGRTTGTGPARTRCGAATRCWPPGWPLPRR